MRSIQRVRIADVKAGNVECLNRVYEPVKDKKLLKKHHTANDKRELYCLPVRSNWVYKWMPFRTYLGRVKMEDIGVTGHYALEEESRREMNRRLMEEKKKRKEDARKQKDDAKAKRKRKNDGGEKKGKGKRKK